ncbi:MULTISPECIES: VWA domain-containing protein [unclassified Rathayibacter]|uniref:vWA domain-containing protein n=1 Tax=unclassified Rathayibacter TaxID=2609250 RepID=UPI0015E3F60F|nr:MULTISPECIES: VWA domain-containing protein [unclassified Rathayibacter]
MSDYAEAGLHGGGIEIAEGQEVMPFYLILDQSWSMDPDLGTLRQAVEQLIAMLRSDPETDDTAMLGVISFGDSARVTIPLSRLSSIGAVPELTSLGGTNFSAAWRAFDQAVRADKKTIFSQKGKIHRPCVFFLTDGEPGDRGEFRNVFLSTQGKDSTKGWPYVVAYGFREAPADVLKDIAYPDFGEKLGQWFLLKDNDPKAVIDQVKSLINQTIVQATSTNAQGQRDLQAAQPTPTANIDHGSVDELIEDD